MSKSSQESFRTARKRFQKQNKKKSDSGWKRCITKWHPLDKILLLSGSRLSQHRAEEEESSTKYSMLYLQRYRGRNRWVFQMNKWCSKSYCWKSRIRWWTIYHIWKRSAKSSRNFQLARKGIYIFFNVQGKKFILLGIEQSI